MSQFEYLAIAVSLILSFTTARYLGGLPSLIGGAGRYWVCVLWALQSLVNVFMYWWTFWTWNEFEGWNLGVFLLILLYPSSTYIGAVILIPNHSESVADWQTYFIERVRRPFFSVAAISTLLSITVAGFYRSALQASEDVEAVYVWAATGYFVALYIVGFWSSSPRVQAFVVLGNLLGIAFVYAPIAFQLQ